MAENLEQMVLEEIVKDDRSFRTFVVMSQQQQAVRLSKIEERTGTLEASVGTLATHGCARSNDHDETHRRLRELEKENRWTKVIAAGIAALAGFAGGLLPGRTSL